MITIQAVKDFLERYEKLDYLIENTNERLAKVWAQATNGTSHLTPDKVQTSGSSSTEDVYIKIGELKDEIKAYEAEQENIIQTIKKVKTPMHYNLLDKYYVQYKKFKTLNDIAEYYGYDESWGSTTHGRALQSMQKVLNEREKHNETSERKTV